MALGKSQPQQFSRDACFWPLGMPRRIPSLASSRANKLISNASRSRCSPDIVRRISSWTACAAGLVSVWAMREC